MPFSDVRAVAGPARGWVQTFQQGDRSSARGQQRQKKSATEDHVQQKSASVGPGYDLAEDLLPPRSWLLIHLLRCCKCQSFNHWEQSHAEEKSVLQDSKDGERGGGSQSWSRRKAKSPESDIFTILLRHPTGGAPATTSILWEERCLKIYSIVQQATRFTRSCVHVLFQAATPHQ